MHLQCEKMGDINRCRQWMKERTPRDQEGAEDHFSISQPAASHLQIARKRLESDNQRCLPFPFAGRDTSFSANYKTNKTTGTSGEEFLTANVCTAG